jgi:hypothetical protein
LFASNTATHGTVPFLAPELYTKGRESCSPHITTRFPAMPTDEQSSTESSV